MYPTEDYGMIKKDDKVVPSAVCSSLITTVGQYHLHEIRLMHQWGNAHLCTALLPKKFPFDGSLPYTEDNPHFDKLTHTPKQATAGNILLCEQFFTRPDAFIFILKLKIIVVTLPILNLVSKFLNNMFLPHSYYFFVRFPSKVKGFGVCKPH